MYHSICKEGTVLIGSYKKISKKKKKIRSDKEAIMKRTFKDSYISRIKELKTDGFEAALGRDSNSKNSIAVSFKAES